MREIREYNMNGTIILGVDNGYGNVKTAHRVFPTGIIKCDSEPVLSKEYISSCFSSTARAVLTVIWLLWRTSASASIVK